MKILLILLSSFLCMYADTLQSPRITDWGDWYDLVSCPGRTYAVGMQLKVEAAQGPSIDDTALNAVRLFCQEFGKTNDGDTSNSIMSGEGTFGDWQDPIFCPDRKMVTGFELRSEPQQGSSDDTAANNFAIYCTDPYDDTVSTVRLEGKGLEWGSWTGAQMCPLYYSVCGIQSQIEPPQGRGDDTSLNNVNLDCCITDFAK